MLRRRPWLAPVIVSALTVALGTLGVWAQANRGEGLLLALAASLAALRLMSWSDRLFDPRLAWTPSP